MMDIAQLNIGNGIDRPRAGESTNPHAKDAINCMACRVTVESEGQREHYRSDWHRVNLKRRVAGLAPISDEEFRRRVTELEEQAGNEKAKKEKGARKAFMCDACNKRFSSEKALEQHLRSRRHLDKVRELGGLPDDEEESTAAEDGEDDVTEEGGYEAVPVPKTECLFCARHAHTVEDSAKHMAKAHGFFVPYVESLYSLDELVGYLGEKVGVGFACVYCSKGFRSVSSARKHMMDKNHTRMVSDESAWYEEYGELYAWEHDNDEDEVEGSEEADGEERELALLGADGAGFQAQGGHDSSATTDDSAMELILGNGMRAGHRSMLRYYKQTPRPKDTRDSVVVSRLMSEYRLLGNGSASVKQASLPSRKQFEAQRRMEEKVARRQYFINKTQTHTKVGTLNSGYRP